MIIDLAYFTGKLNLPQIGNTEGNAAVTAFAEQHEAEYLTKALGYDLAKAFAEGIDGSGEPVSGDRWDKLLNGDEFTYQGRTYKWGGFMNDQKISPIGNYVYYRYLEHKSHDVTLNGAVKSTTDNNRTVPMTYKMVSAWNDMVAMNNTLWAYLWVNMPTYPEWKEYNSPGIIGWSYPFNCERNELFKKMNTFGI